MSGLGLFAAVVSSLSVADAPSGHVVPWGDSTSPVIRDFPDSLAGTRWIRACGDRSVAYRAHGKLRWWGARAFDPLYSPSHRQPLRALACSEELWFGLTDTGTVLQWGPAPSMGDPKPPAGLRDVVGIAAGSFHGVALKSDGSVVAWGANLDSVVTRTNGRTGIAAVAAAGVQTILLREDSTVDVAGGKLTMVDQIPRNLRGVVAVAAGGRHALALLADSTVVAWGDSTGGALRVPVDLASVVAIAAGAYHSLALRRDGSVVCWGNNAKGQCDVPSAAVEVVGIAAGAEHSLALRRDGKVVGWGANAQGQCDAPFRTLSVESIHLGRKAAAAILTDGRPVLWGEGPASAPPDLPAGRRWTSISFGSTPHAVGLDDQGKPYAWGANTLSVATMPESLQAGLQVEAGRVLSLVLTPRRQLVAWGEDNDGLVSGPSALRDVVQFDAAEYRVVALRADSTVHQWGKQVFAGIDVAPDSTRGAIAVAATDQSFLALLPSRRVFAWNPRGLAAWHRPPAGLDSVVALSAGSVHALALRADGEVVCWGDPAARLCDVPRDLPPASVALAGEKVSLALVPVRPIPGVPTGITPSRPAAVRLGLRAEAEGLRWMEPGDARIRIVSAAGRPVAGPTTVRSGERFGAGLPRGVYYVRIEGRPGTQRWVHTGR